MPKLSDPSKKQLRAMLDRRTSAFVRAQGKCEKTGVTHNLTNSHIISRTYIKVQFDPRNVQCITSTEHGILEGNPILFARYVEQSSCGQYVDTMLVQAHNASAKPDYMLWVKVWDTIEQRGYTLEQAREWLGQQILLSEYDLLLID